MSGLTVDFAGEIVRPAVGVEFTIGRDADLTVDDDNPFLHRRFLALSEVGGLWWLSNVGGTLSATVADARGALQAWLGPGARLPVVFERTRVWFSAGSTTYEIDLVLDEPPFAPAEAQPDPDGSLTIGRVSLTPAQKMLVLALAEDALRRGDRAPSSIPSSAAAAARLGWPVTRFNRKLDNVCEKLSALGVRGLHGGPERLASTRKARLVEYALAARIVVAEDLRLLPPRTETYD